MQSIKEAEKGVAGNINTFLRQLKDARTFQQFWISLARPRVLSFFGAPSPLALLCFLVDRL